MEYSAVKELVNSLMKVLVFVALALLVSFATLIVFLGVLLLNELNFLRALPMMAFSILLIISSLIELKRIIIKDV